MITPLLPLKPLAITTTLSFAKLAKAFAHLILAQDLKYLLHIVPILSYNPKEAWARLRLILSLLFYADNAQASLIAHRLIPLCTCYLAPARVSGNSAIKAWADGKKSRVFFFLLLDLNLRPEQAYLGSFLALEETKQTWFYQIETDHAVTQSKNNGITEL